MIDVEGLNPFLFDANQRLSPVMYKSALSKPSLLASDFGTLYPKRTLFRAIKSDLVKNLEDEAFC